MNFSLYDESSLTAHIKLNNCGHEYDYADFKPRYLIYNSICFSPLLLSSQRFCLWNFKDLTKYVITSNCYQERIPE